MRYSRDKDIQDTDMSKLLLSRNISLIVVVLFGRNTRLRATYCFHHIFCVIDLSYLFFYRRLLILCYSLDVDDDATRFVR